MKHTWHSLNNLDCKIKQDTKKGQLYKTVPQMFAYTGQFSSNGLS